MSLSWESGWGLVAVCGGLSICKSGFGFLGRKVDALSLMRYVEDIRGYKMDLYLYCSRLPLKLSELMYSFHSTRFQMAAR